MKLFNSIWKRLNGWKTTLGYILATTLGSYPMLVGAIEAFVKDQSAQNIGNLVAQILLAVGVGHGVIKKVS